MLLKKTREEQTQLRQTVSAARRIRTAIEQQWKEKVKCKNHHLQ